jgi:oligopeptide transport system substrate-binding protein
MAASGASMNFDLSSGTGWGPDYGDPATFLNTLAWEGDLMSNLGFDATKADEAKYNLVLGDYREILEEASSITSREEESDRYAMLAAAEAELLNSAVIMPNTTDGGGYAISRIIPRTNQRTFFGTDDSRFKYMVLTQDALTVDQRQEVLDDWDAKYAEYFGEEN